MRLQNKFCGFLILSLLIVAGCTYRRVGPPEPPPPPDEITADRPELDLRADGPPVTLPIAPDPERRFGYSLPEPMPDPFHLAEEFYIKGFCADAVGHYETFLAFRSDGLGVGEALLHLAICYGLPQSEVHDQERFEETLEQLVSRFPESLEVYGASLILRLLDRVRSLEQQNRALETRLEALSQELEKLKEIDLRRSRQAAPNQ